MSGIQRTEEEILALLADFGSQDEEVAKRALNFIPLGFEMRLAKLDALEKELGYFGEGIKLRLTMLRENLTSVDGKARSDLLLGIGEKASAKLYYKTPSLTPEEERKK